MDQGNCLRTGTEVWDDGNTANDDGCKTPGSDGETSNKLAIINFYYKIKKSYLFDIELKKILLW